MTIAVARGGLLEQGEIVEIPDSVMGPYQRHVELGRLTRLDVPDEAPDVDDDPDEIAEEVSDESDDSDGD